MAEIKHMEQCQLCGSSFQYGPGAYHGKFIPRYKITVCNICYAANWDGWAPHLEGKLLALLKENGIQPPERNSKGLLPRD